MSFWQRETEKSVWGLLPEVLKISVLSVVRADKVLVLAPHPDDDAMGCGGLIKMLSSSGARVKVVYFTDGSRGNRQAKFSENLIATREEESREAGRVLGIGEEKFLRLPHTALSSDIKLAAQIRREIEFDQPDLILSPSFEELHPDHHAVAEALALALKNFNHHINIWLYEIWGTGRFNRLVLVDQEIEAKGEALDCHKSQAKIKQHKEAVLALNNYRALSVGAGKYAEAYYATGPRNYRKLFEFYRRHHESRL